MMEQKSSLDQTSSESFFFFNPRTPCGVRQTGGEITWTRCWFQSTHSLRSATHRFQLAAIHPLFQSTHSLRSATSKIIVFPCGFQSTHSLRSATADAQREIERKRVSIHALLAECDVLVPQAKVSFPGFNPRTPCGVRPEYSPPSIQSDKFQSTHSLRSATFLVHRYYLTPAVSIHALLAECDRVIVVRGLLR